MTDEPTKSDDQAEIPVEVEAPAAAAPAEDPKDPKADVAALEAKLATAEKATKDNYDKYLRSVADLENLRKRQRREMDDAKLEMKHKVLKEMLPVVDNLEVTAVDAEGHPFDPNVHEAISQLESDKPAGTVVQVLQRGYKSGDRLLRPALVVVAKAKAEPASPSTPDEPKA